jgi:hypothetical protein
VKSLRRKPRPSLQLQVNRLARSLRASDRLQKPYVDVNEASDETAQLRQAAISAMRAIESFLNSQGITSVTLVEIRLDLQKVAFPGEIPALFRPSRRAGRKPDSKAVEGLKGRLAGMAYVQMEFGLARNEAAAWVARNTPGALGRQLANKPISSASIKEWMDKFGCNARTRRMIRWEHVLENSSFIAQEIKSKRMKGSFGELECLRMIGLGRKCLASGEPVPFKEIFDVLKNSRFMEYLVDLQNK